MTSALARRLPAACLVLLLALWPVAVLAHAQLISANPEAGSVVETLPDSVTLTFSEGVAPLVLRWITPQGGAVEVTGQAVNQSVTVPMPPASGEGSYLLSWRVVSADGHPVGGVLALHLGVASAEATGETRTHAALAAAGVRFLLSLAMLAPVGLALHAAFIARTAPGRRARRVGYAGALAGLGWALALLWLHGLDLLGLPLRPGVGLAPWQAALAAPLPRTLALSVLALILGALALRRPNPPLALAAWAFAGLSFAASGHAVTAPPAVLSTLAMAAHGMALVWWMGLLAPLLGDLRHAEASLRLRRFSGPALGLVPVLVLSGAWLTWAQTGGDLMSLWGSDWGNLLAIKLALVAGLLVLAALNRLRLTPALAAGNPAPLDRVIRGEVVLGIAVLLLAALFRLNPPPRALIAPAPPLYVHLHTDRAMADLRITPGAPGPVRLEMAFSTGSFEPLTPREVAIALTPADGRIEPLRSNARLAEDGLWHSAPLTLPFAGEWEVAIRILITDFESHVLRETVSIAP